LWVRADRHAEFVIQPPSDATSIMLALRNAPLANVVTITSGDDRRALELDPDQRMVIPLATRAPGAPAFVELRARTGFRPAEVDPASDDMRLLGCWIEFR
jgi:hypothetical protein